MALPNIVISSDQRCAGYALRGRKSRIPTRAMLHGSDGFAFVVPVFTRGFVAHQLLARNRMLAVCKARELLLFHLSAKAPLIREFAVPLTDNPVAFGVVVGFGIS